MKYDTVIDFTGKNAPSPDDSGETVVEAADAAAAAEAACEQRDQYDDYDVISAGEVMVYVRSVGEQDWQAYTVTAETVPVYSAREKRSTTVKNS